MRLTTKTNLAEVERDLDRFAAEIQRVAAPRVLKALADTAQTTGFRRITEIYQVPAATMRGFAQTRVSELEATITVRGKGFPLYAFKPIQTRQGVSVLIKGRRVLIPGSFIATMPNGHRGVFARGAYGGKGVAHPSGKSFGRFKFGYSRRINKPRDERTTLSINEFYTLSPPDAFSNADVVLAMQDQVEARAGTLLQREIRAIALGFKR